MESNDAVHCYPAYVGGVTDKANSVTESLFCNLKNARFKQRADKTLTPAPAGIYACQETFQHQTLRPSLLGATSPEAFEPVSFDAPMRRCVVGKPRHFLKIGRIRSPRRAAPNKVTTPYQVAFSHWGSVKSVMYALLRSEMSSGAPSLTRKVRGLLMALLRIELSPDQGAKCRAIVHRRCQPTQQCQPHQALCTTGRDILDRSHTLVRIKW
jgi:hypothetical protein